MQTQKPTLELLTCKGAYRDNPTALFHQLCGDRPATLLLESADIDSKDDLKSLLLVDSALRITALGDTVTIQALSGNGEALLALLDNALPANGNCNSCMCSNLCDNVCYDSENRAGRSRPNIIRTAIKIEKTELQNVLRESEDFQQDILHSEKRIGTILQEQFPTSIHQDLQ